VTSKCVRYVGNLDFHDGFIRAVTQSKDQVLVTVEGSSGKHYTVGFEGVSFVEAHSPQDMMLYALSEVDAEVESHCRYEFINSYVDEPEKEKSKSHLTDCG
jgi:hypothetical protein